MQNTKEMNTSFFMLIVLAWYTMSVVYEQQEINKWLSDILRQYRAVVVGMIKIMGPVMCWKEIDERKFKGLSGNTFLTPMLSDTLMHNEQVLPKVWF